MPFEALVGVSREAVDLFNGLGSWGYGSELFDGKHLLYLAQNASL